MALSPEDRRILSEAHGIILRESLAAQEQLGRMAALQHWAAMIMATSDDAVACENASTAHRLAGEAAAVLERQDRRSLAALDHIDTLNPPRE